MGSLVGNISDADTGELVQSLVLKKQTEKLDLCLNGLLMLQTTELPPDCSPKAVCVCVHCLTVIALCTGQVPGLGAEGSPQHPGHLGGPALPQASPGSCAGAVATVTGPALLHLIFIKGGLRCGLAWCVE